MDHEHELAPLQARAVEHRAHGHLAAEPMRRDAVFDGIFDDRLQHE